MPWAPPTRAEQGRPPSASSSLTAKQVRSGAARGAAAPSSGRKEHCTPAPGRRLHWQAWGGVTAGKLGRRQKPGVPDGRGPMAYPGEAKGALWEGKRLLNTNTTRRRRVE